MTNTNGKAEERASYLGSRIPNSLRRECLKCFQQGLGYKLTARTVGLKASAVREYNRKFKKGDLKWVERGGKD